MRSTPPIRSGQVRSGRVPCPSPFLTEACFWVHWCLSCPNKTVFPEEVTAAGSPFLSAHFLPYLLEGQAWRAVQDFLSQEGQGPLGGRASATDRGSVTRYGSGGEASQGRDSCRERHPRLRSRPGVHAGRAPTGAPPCRPSLPPACHTARARARSGPACQPLERVVGECVRMCIGRTCVRAGCVWTDARTWV